MMYYALVVSVETSYHLTMWGIFIMLVAYVYWGGYCIKLHLKAIIDSRADIYLLQR